LRFTGFKKKLAGSENAPAKREMSKTSSTKKGGGKGRGEKREFTCLGVILSGKPDETTSPPHWKKKEDCRGDFDSSAGGNPGQEQEEEKKEIFKTGKDRVGFTSETDLPVRTFF